jgi:hypothetical protein
MAEKYLLGAARPPKQSMSGPTEPEKQFHQYLGATKQYPNYLLYATLQPKAKLAPYLWEIPEDVDQLLAFVLVVFQKFWTCNVEKKNQRHEI